MLFLRDQDITDAEHAAFARTFGELEDHPLTDSVEGEPGIIHIYKSPSDKPVRYENIWHTDAAWREVPPLGAGTNVTGGVIDGCGHWIVEERPDIVVARFNGFYRNIDAPDLRESTE